ncbi:MAG: hypothetical protein IID08_06030 [Candidatus Hydrogenedentes bacterium]|nr:hypothetical protein [Candidatus Hydrogenedentota bacterium]
MAVTRKKILVAIVACVVVLTVCLEIYSKATLSAQEAATPDERLSDAYKHLKYLGIENWYEAACTVGVYGEPDEATEAIIDLLQNRESPTADNMNLLKGWSERRIAGIQDRSYLARLHVLTPLGLTRTERAEKFLLNAYRNPQDLEAIKKFRELRQRSFGHHVPSLKDIEEVTRQHALSGLLLLDQQKYFDEKEKWEQSSGISLVIELRGINLFFVD